MSVMVNSPHSTIHNQCRATEKVIIVQFAVRQEPGEKGPFLWDGGAETAGPDFVYRGAVAVMVLSIQCVWTPIHFTPQHTTAVGPLPPLESGARDPSIPQKFKNGSTHTRSNYLIQTA